MSGLLVNYDSSEDENVSKSPRDDNNLRKSYKSEAPNSPEKSKSNLREPKSETTEITTIEVPLDETSDDEDAETLAKIAAYESMLPKEPDGECDPVLEVICHYKCL
jgi:hypothetical protein